MKITSQEDKTRTVFPTTIQQRDIHKYQSTIKVSIINHYLILSNNERKDDFKLHLFHI